MYRVLIFKQDEDRNGILFGDLDWRIASTHSHKVDAERQLSLFIENGIDAEKVKLDSDSE